MVGKLEARTASTQIQRASVGSAPLGWWQTSGCFLRTSIRAAISVIVTWATIAVAGTTTDPGLLADGRAALTPALAGHARASTLDTCAQLANVAAAFCRKGARRPVSCTGTADSARVLTSTGGARHACAARPTLSTERVEFRPSTARTLRICNQRCQCDEECRPEIPVPMSEREAQCGRLPSLAKCQMIEGVGTTTLRNIQHNLELAGATNLAQCLLPKQCSVWPRTARPTRLLRIATSTPLARAHEMAIPTPNMWTSARHPTRVARQHDDLDSGSRRRLAGRMPLQSQLCVQTTSMDTHQASGTSYRQLATCCAPRDLRRRHAVRPANRSPKARQSCEYHWRGHRERPAPDRRSSKYRRDRGIRS